MMTNLQQHSQIQKIKQTQQKILKNFVKKQIDLSFKFNNNQMLKIVDNYTLTEYLGKGEYGKVYKAYNINTKIDVAIKMIPISKFEEITKLVQLTRNELQILKLLQDNGNVINFVEMIKTVRYIYLVYEYCQGGTLQSLIRSQGYFQQKQALKIFKQLINAFRSLNQNYILHRDVKPNNIFFKAGLLKLADFGFCKKLKNFDDLTQTSLGSPLYMAPEVLNGQVYDSKADVWSVGIVLYQMLFGKCPYGDCNIKQLINIYSSQKLRINMLTDGIEISSTTQNMLRRMLEKDQLKRISWQDLFYEYEIDDDGNIKKKQKDFQYDLMKLMKKNFSSTQLIKIKTGVANKIDWTKITDKYSSVHSQELNYNNKDVSEGDIDEIFNLKRKVKEFQSDYQKRLQLSAIIQEMINSIHQKYRYSSTICYFLVYNLQEIVGAELPNLQKFINEFSVLLLKCPNESNILNRMLVVFRNQAEALSVRLNSLKISLMASQDFQRRTLKYPQKSVMGKQISKFIHGFEQKYPGITDLCSLNITPQKKNDMIYLIKILWGVSLIKKQNKGKDTNVISIKQETSIQEMAKILNKLIVSINS